MDYTPPPANDLREPNPEYCALLRAELDALYDESLTALVAANNARRVRILRGGYRGDYAKITGRGMAGGYTVTTDSGVPLAFPLDALEVVK